MKKMSVVIPTIGRMEYLDLAIESLVKQDIPFDEIILFDNSPTQDTRNQSKFGYDDKITWVNSGEHLGPVQSWNGAVNSCKNEYVTIFGDDDIALPHFHTEAQKALSRSNFAVLPFRAIDEKGCKLVGRKRKYFDMNSEAFRHKRMLRRLGLVVPGVFFRKRIFLKVNGFETSYLPNAIALDELLWFKMSAIEKEVAFSDKICWHYRVHSGQVGILTDLKQFNENVEKYVDKLTKSLVDIGINKDSIFPISRQHFLDGLLYIRFSKVIINKMYGNGKLNSKTCKDAFNFFRKHKTTFKVKLFAVGEILKWLIKIVFLKFNRFVSSN